MLSTSDFKDKTFQTIQLFDNVLVWVIFHKMTYNCQHFDQIILLTLIKQSSLWNKLLFFFQVQYDHLHLFNVFSIFFTIIGIVLYDSY